MLVPQRGLDMTLVVALVVALLLRLSSFSALVRLPMSTSALLGRWWPLVALVEPLSVRLLLPTLLSMPHLSASMVPALRSSLDLGGLRHLLLLPMVFLDHRRPSLVVAVPCLFWLALPASRR